MESAISTLVMGCIVGLMTLALQPGTGVKGWALFIGLAIIGVSVSLIP